MNSLKIYENQEFGKVRVQEIKNEPWFVAKDICDILEIKNTIQAVQQLEEDEVCKTYITDSLGRNQETNVINESGLYALVLRSNKPNAKKFRKWVTNEVLPNIRKNGIYATDVTIENMIANPDFAIGLLNKLKEEKEQRMRLESKVEVDKPKVIFANSVSHSSNLILIRDLAKIICQNGYEIGEKRLFNWLRMNGYLTKKNLPTQKSIDLGILKTTEYAYTNNHQQLVTTLTTKVTGKGQIYFVNKFLKEVA